MIDNAPSVGELRRYLHHASALLAMSEADGEEALRLMARARHWANAAALGIEQRLHDMERSEFGRTLTATAVLVTIGGSR